MIELWRYEWMRFVAFLQYLSMAWGCLMASYLIYTAAFDVSLSVLLPTLRWSFGIYAAGFRGAQATI